MDRGAENRTRSGPSSCPRSRCRRTSPCSSRLPLHRVYQLKSGGVASILREDAGGVGELMFSMLYNPWRAIIQLLGSMAVLAWVDWRLLAGSLLLLPAVYFSHRPGETWHFVKETQGVRLLPDSATRPDFAFCFTPGAIDDLAAVDGGIDGVAVVLFDLMLSEDPARRVGFRVLAPFWRLVRHSHLRLVLEAGPRVLAYGAGHGIRTLGQLRAFVATLRAASPEEVAPNSGGC